MKIPTKFVTVECNFGSGKKHLYSTDVMTRNLQYHPDEASARKAAGDLIREGTKMVALMEVKTLLVAKPVEFDEIAE